MAETEVTLLPKLVTAMPPMLLLSEFQLFKLTFWIPATTVDEMVLLKVVENVKEPGDV
jgi:hypothetical protein